MKSEIRVIVFVLAGMVTLPQSAPARRANDIVVCSGTNQNCYYAPANIKLPAYCFKGEFTYGGRVVFRCDAQTYGSTTGPPDLGPATKLLRPGPPVFGDRTIGVSHIDHGAGASASVGLVGAAGNSAATSESERPNRRLRPACASAFERRAYCAPELRSSVAMSDHE
jgi:hypothetical protein